MNKIIHRSNTRGYADHGWLKTHHTFSFANYFNRERMNFGNLRVLNDDWIAGGQGFGTHPHDNMEIITIPLSGDLAHADSMGNQSIIKQGDVQVMSAGSGITHSEFNPNEDIACSLLQIWVYPNAKNVEPRYDQISIRDIDTHNKFGQILSPNAEDQGVWIHQNSWFHIGNFDSNVAEEYQIKSSENGVYLFVINGMISLDDMVLNTRDGIGIWNTESIKIKALEASQVLLMEVPMQLQIK